MTPAKKNVSILSSTLVFHEHTSSDNDNSRVLHCFFWISESPDMDLCLKYYGRDRFQPYKAQSKCWDQVQVIVQSAPRKVVARWPCTMHEAYWWRHAQECSSKDFSTLLVLRALLWTGLVFSPFTIAKKTHTERSQNTKHGRTEELNKHVSVMAAPLTSHDFVTNPLKESLPSDWSIDCAVSLT